MTERRRDHPRSRQPGPGDHALRRLPRAISMPAKSRSGQSTGKRPRPPPSPRRLRRARPSRRRCRPLPARARHSPRRPSSSRVGSRARSAPKAPFELASTRPERHQGPEHRPPIADRRSRAISARSPRRAALRAPPPCHRAARPPSPSRHTRTRRHEAGSTDQRAAPAHIALPQRLDQVLRDREHQAVRARRGGDRLCGAVLGRLIQCSGDPAAPPSFR